MVHLKKESKAIPDGGAQRAERVPGRDREEQEQWSEGALWRWPLRDRRRWKLTSFSWAPKSLRAVTAAVKLRRLRLGRKAMTNLNTILKSRDITLPTKVHIVRAMVFPVVIYRYESWAIKKTELQRVDAFEPGC